MPHPDEPASGADTPIFLSPTPPHAVLIVEDDPFFRDYLARAITQAPELRLAGTATDVTSGLSALDTLRPDVLLVDIGLPGGEGTTLIHHARRHLPQCEVMVITVFANEDVVFRCIEAGATGYLLKDSGELDIAAQIALLLGGGSPITPSIARRLLKRLAPTEPLVESNPGISLSNQEQAVLRLCGKGYRFEEIGQLLNLSRHTVETYIKRVYRKLQVHSKTEAVYEARKLGLVDD